MRRPRFHLRSMMALVLVAALGMAATLHLSRLGPNDLAEQAAVLVPFLILVGLKLGLAVASRRRRTSSGGVSQARAEGKPVPP